MSSRSVKALRERYGTSGNKSDRSDAYVLADCLRTDGHRWRSLEPDSPATITLRTHVRARKDLVETRVAVANQLRAHLRVVFPGAVGLFKAIDSPITLRFLERFPSATRAGWLSEKRLGAWLAANSYSGKKKTAAELHNRLAAEPAGINGDEGDARGAITVAYVTILKALRVQIDELNTRLDELLDAPPRRRHLPVSAPLRHHPSSDPARRDRRLASPVPRRRVADLPRRCRPLDPGQRPPPHRHLSLQQRQEARRRPLRLRRRQLARQRLGRTALPRPARRRQEPPPRRTHPRPQLDPHHLALLARPHPLRPHPPRRPPTPQPTGGLT